MSKAVLDQITDEWESVIDPDVSHLVARIDCSHHDLLVQPRGSRIVLTR